MNTATISDVFDDGVYALRPTPGLSSSPSLSDCGVSADWQVREDKGLYVPDILSDEDREINSAAYTAAHDHAKYLRKAELQVHRALNLVGLMREAIGDNCDARAMQTETALTTIEKTLRKAVRLVNKHDRRHTNLFLAYVGLKQKAED